MSNETRMVVKDNALIDASFNLSLVEQRLMLLAIVEARNIQSITANTSIEITASAYSNQYSIELKESYSVLKQASKTLKRREFTYLDKYKGNEGYSTVNWVNKVTYIPNKGMIVLKFSDEVISLISKLESHFTRYHLNQISDFKSKYSVRLYELLVKWLSLGKTDLFLINDLRNKLGIASTEYKTMSLFKANVLDKAVNEINQKATNTSISYSQVKDGRNIKGFIFTIKEKVSLKPKLVKDSDTPDLFHNLTEKQIDYFSVMLSNLNSFQNFFKGLVGESMDDYKERIKIELQKGDKAQEWKVYLDQVKFKREKRA